MHYALFCGGREVHGPVAEQAVTEVLTFMRHFYGGSLRVMHGGARGADELAGRVAESLGVPTKAFPADWGRGKQAGYERNAYMAGLLVDWEHRGHSVEVISLPGGRGTQMMCDLAEKSGLNVTHIPIDGYGLVAS